MTIPGGDDLGGLLEGLGRLQRQLEDAQAAAADTEVVGSAGGDAVRIRAAGEFEFLSVEIDPATVPGADASLLEDLVLALHDTVAKLQAAREAVVGAVVGDALGNLLGGGDLGNLGMFADIDDVDEDDETDEDDTENEADDDNGGDEGGPGGERPRTGE